MPTAYGGQTAPESSPAQKGKPGTLLHPFLAVAAVAHSLFLFCDNDRAPDFFFFPPPEPLIFNGAYGQPGQGHFPGTFAARCGHVPTFWPMDHEGD